LCHWEKEREEHKVGKIKEKKRTEKKKGNEKLFYFM
jgi:hypothetical protein